MRGPGKMYPAMAEAGRLIFQVADKSAGVFPASVSIEGDLLERVILELLDHPTVKREGLRCDAEGRVLLMGVGLEALRVPEN